MTNLLIFSLCYCSFCAFALAKFGHYRDVFGGRPSTALSNRLQWFGWLLSLLSLGFAVYSQAGYGSLLYLGMAGLSIFLLVLLLNFRPQWLKPSFLCIAVANSISLCALTLF
jgi:hypothetical protein